MAYTYEEFCETYTPIAIKRQRAISFRGWLSSKGIVLPDSAITLEIEILFGSITPNITRNQKGEINSKIREVQRIRELQEQYYAEVPEIKVSYTPNERQAEAMRRVAYKRYLRTLEKGE